MVKQRIVVPITPLQRVEDVKTRLQTHSKIKAIAALAYRGKEETWFDGYTISNRYVTIKVVGDEMWARYEDREDWIYAGVLKK